MMPASCSTGYRAHPREGRRHLLPIAGGAVGGVHDAAGIGVGRRRDERPVRDTAQDPLVLQGEVSDQAQPGLRLGVRLVVELAVRHRLDDPQGRLYFVFEVGDEKVGDGLCFLGIHAMLLCDSVSNNG